MNWTRFLVLFIFLCNCSASICQSTLYFRKQFGDPFPKFEAGETVNTLQSGYLVGAYRLTTNPHDVDAYVIKTDLLGNIIWQFDIQDSTSQSLIVSSISDDGYYYFAGEVNDISSNDYNGYLLKADSSGAIIWEKSIGDPLINNSIYCIKNSLDGNLFMTGWIEDTSTTYWQGYLIKSDTSGNVIWSQSYQGLYNNVITDLIELPDSNLALIGRTEFVLGSGKVWLLIVDSIGNVITHQSYFVGSSGPGNYFQVGNSFDRTIDSTFIICGHGGSTPTLTRGLLIKLNNFNQVAWYKMLTSNPDGTGQIWESTFAKVRQLADSSFVCLGTYSLNGTAPNKIILLKTDFYGNEIWRRFYSSTNGFDSYGYGMDLTPDGGFILTGRGEDSTDADVYLIKTNCLGFTNGPVADFSVIWNGNSATFLNLSIRADTCIYYFGDGDSALVHLTDTTNINHLYSSSGPWQAYMVSYACGEADTLLQTITTNLNSEILDNNNTFRIYPNPSSNSLFISWTMNVDYQNAYLNISDLSGRIIYSTPVEMHLEQLELDISSLPQGSYSVEFNSEGLNPIVRKMLIVR